MNWYQRFFRRASVAYGYWIAPDGTETPVPFQQHDAVAKSLLQQLGLPFHEWTQYGDEGENEEELMNRGYCRILTYDVFGCECKSQPTPQQQAATCNIFYAARLSTAYLYLPTFEGKITGDACHQLQDYLKGKKRRAMEPQTPMAPQTAPVESTATV